MIAAGNIRAFAVLVLGLAAWTCMSDRSARAEPEAKSSQAAPQLIEPENALRVATKALREAVGDEGQQAAKVQLLAAIGNYFDADFNNRRQQLAQIDARLSKMKDELDQLIATKNDVIQRQLTAMEKNDAGLGSYTRDDMSTLLATYFDADMKIRQSKLADMAARAKSLHAQLDKRRAARDEIIQLQLNVLVNEAAGLGFYSPVKGQSHGIGMLW